VNQGKVCFDRSTCRSRGQDRCKSGKTFLERASEKKAGLSPVNQRRVCFDRSTCRSRGQDRCKSGKTFLKRASEKKAGLSLFTGRFLRTYPCSGAGRGKRGQRLPRMHGPVYDPWEVHAFR
jgi:hypothetical protein